MTTTIHDVLSKKLSALSGDITLRVIDLMVEQETAKRAKQAVAALEEHKRLTREMRRHEKPTAYTYNLDGSVASSSYTKEGLKLLKDTQDRMAKIDKALEAALASGNFKLLDDLGANEAPEKGVHSAED